MHIHVELLRRKVEGEIHEGVLSFGEKGRVDCLQAALDGRAVDEPVVDEEDEHHPLHAVVRVAHEPVQLHFQRRAFRSYLEQLAGDGGAVDVADVVDGLGLGPRPHVRRVLPCSLAREPHLAEAQSVAAHHLHNLVVFVGGVLERLAAAWHVVEQILDRYDRPLHPRARSRICRVSFLRRDECGIAVVCLVRARATSCHSCEAKMCHVAHTRQCLPPEAKCVDGCQIIVGFQFARCEALYRNS
mmetsp:Transcript_21904/g.44384  ORF Transcript_21904/g.44384 Transcript_21904/m.44384 type:complete len:243 (-) Transcript_21904:224-952(-)